MPFFLTLFSEKNKNMKIAVLGTGAVGKTIASKLIELGHDVCMGSRTANNDIANAWVHSQGDKAKSGSFADAAEFGEIIFNCTKGEHSLEALKQAGAERIAYKILIDISNPLDFSKGFPPSLTICNTSSQGESIQNLFPNAKVIKTLNTVTNAVMINPSIIAGDHDQFICGNDEKAKEQVITILKEWFGWKNVIDLGDITNARATEMILPLWVRLYGKLQTANFNLKVVQ